MVLSVCVWEYTSILFAQRKLWSYLFAYVSTVRKSEQWSDLFKYGKHMSNLFTLRTWWSYLLYMENTCPFCSYNRIGGLNCLYVGNIFVFLLFAQRKWWSYLLFHMENVCPFCSHNGNGGLTCFYMGNIRISCSHNRNARFIWISIRLNTLFLVLIFASLWALFVIYLLPIMIHGWVRRPPVGLNKRMFLLLWKLRARVGLPVS